MAQTITGVVMAGGDSRRMGRDKALLKLPDGLSLLERAVATLREAGASEIIVSVGRGKRYGISGTREVSDDAVGCGPIAGLAACLETAAHPLCLILAVDMPGMTTTYLKKLIASATAERGAVPLSNGSAEPLAAVYPKAAGSYLREAMAKGDYSLQALMKNLSKIGLVAPMPVEEDEKPLFANWNRPEDCA